MKPKLIKGNAAVDDRGILTFVNDFDFKGIKRFYTVHNYPDTSGIRGWHGHKSEAKYVFVMRGLADFLLSSMETSKKYRFALSGEHPEILFIPPGFYHAFRTRTKKNQIIFYSTATLEQSKADDFREIFTKEDVKLFRVVIR
jgi:dTDP-4-dehydrorhamnose 3,5-epimerase-like enzyme